MTDNNVMAVPLVVKVPPEVKNTLTERAKALGYGTTSTYVRHILLNELAKE